MEIFDKPAQQASQRTQVAAPEAICQQVESEDAKEQERLYNREDVKTG